MVQEGELALNYPEAPAVDSITESDTLFSPPEPHYGIVLTPPEKEPPAPVRQSNDSVSFILCGLFILFLIIALRFRNNVKYALKVFQDLIEVRTRQNVFDDTVNETSLIVLLNGLWCACAGIIGFCVFEFFYPSGILWHHRVIGMLWGMAIAFVYELFMWGAYAAVGWVFSDRTHSAMWVKGFSASQALMAPALFVTALIGICRPDTALQVGMVSAFVFILSKLVFIWKGYRIFFNQFSSWVLFLCYLCSLEIVPLILCYRCALFLNEVL